MLLEDAGERGCRSHTLHMGSGPQKNVTHPADVLVEEGDIFSSTSSQLLKPHFILKKKKNNFSTDNQRPFTFVINSSYFECHVVLVVLN